MPLNALEFSYLTEAETEAWLLPRSGRPLGTELGTERLQTPKLEPFPLTRAASSRSVPGKQLKT